MDGTPIQFDGAVVRPRRDEYPDLTRAAVLDAARQLFAERGFFQAKVQEIAKLSRVSQATVYAQCGGKQGLLRSLMDNWTQSPMVRQSEQECLSSDDPALVMRTLTDAYLRIIEEWGDVVQVIIDVAPHDEESRAVLDTAQQRHNLSLAAICRHLEDIGALREEVDAERATQIITYYYGIDGLLRTRKVFGWSFERSNEWLSVQASTAVLASAS
ncbi:TetR/AcrR family transcriptional regulator [Streptomyces sp. NPDC059629]|uniref:TetR/AcrR family transcriptional regulator n=1 Tax=Streptomyces sp. NPDC059629 TaxID=3346889 RepID=UPI0036BE79B6